MKSKKYTQSFIVFCLLYMLLLIGDKEDMAWWLKPVLIPILISIVSVSEPFKTQKTLLLALFCSWIGDVLLLFADQNALFFISGLVSFLVAHLIYIYLFHQQEIQYNRKSYLKFIPIVAVYLLVMLSFLWDTLQEMKIPVTVYAIVISMMLFMSIKAFFQWGKPSNFWVLIGAILFVISDSILAINKFHSPVPMSSFWIMSTYLGAQFCIVNSILKYNSKILA
ncbi:lysoplasmalogenase [Flavobacterium sp.]|uniref:lysoplasmalogenase n=1 Tax=Flavobacterium sp. TaxID=239 RepID=UPI002FDAC2E8